MWFPTLKVPATFWPLQKAPKDARSLMRGEGGGKRGLVVWSEL